MQNTVEPSTRSDRPKSLTERIRSTLGRLFSHDLSGVLSFLILLCVVTGILNENFWSARNVVNLLRSVSFTGLAALGMTFVIISGGIDLSVGSVIGLAGVVAGVSLQAQQPVPLAILFALIAGLTFGVINGFFVARIKIPAFIVTLGNLYIAKGLVYIFSGARPIYPFPDSFNSLGTAEFLGLPLPVYIMLVAVLVTHYLLNHTVYGRSVLAVGGNERTARTSGINVDRVRFIAYVMLGFFAALTGILITARMNSAIPGAGDGWELKAIASAIIGGTSVAGGIGSILGTLVGASIMAVLENAMVMLKVSVYWQNVVVGVIIIFAVVFDHYKRMRNA